MIDQATVDRILDAAQIVDVVSDFVTLRKRGVNYVGLCPFHDDRTPSFSVSPARNICKCFACGKGGNPVHFIMEHEQITYTEALKYLAKKYGIEVKERELSNEERQAQNDRESAFIVNQFARDYYHDILLNNPDGRSIGLAYFRNRGFRDDIIEKFQLGYALQQRDAFPKTAIAKGYNEKYIVSEDGDKAEIIPVRNILRTHNKVQMLIMEMRPLTKVGEDEPAGLFQQQYDDGEVPHQRYSASHWESVFTFDKEHERISPSVINKAVSQIFLMPEEKRPQYILMLAGSKVMLLDQDKWARGSYLIFSLDELFSQASISAFRNYYALFHLLVCKDTLAADSETLLMSSLIEDSYRNAYSVTQDLKQGVVKAVETIANEALYYMKNVAHQPFGKKQEDGTYGL